MRKALPAFILPLALAPLLLCSCATSKAARLPADPVALLSYSSEGAVPAALAAIPASFVLPALQEMGESGLSGSAGASPAREFLAEFFSRADCVFASIMRNGESGALFCRVIALGKFPSALRLMLGSSRDWEKIEAGGAAWFESSALIEGGALRAALPTSGALLAEMDILPPSIEGGAPSRSMADFVNAASGAAELEPSAAWDAGSAFPYAAEAALLGAANAPFAFYVPDFNLFARAVLPAMPGFPLAGAAAAISAIGGFSLPISSIEISVDRAERLDGAEPMDRLTLRAAVPSAALMRAASFIVQLMFPGGSVSAEGGALTVQKDIPQGRAAIAVLSFFLVS